MLAKVAATDQIARKPAGPNHPSSTVALAVADPNNCTSGVKQSMVALAPLEDPQFGGLGVMAAKQQWPLV